MTSPLVVQVAGPHPAAVCILPATSPDDAAKLSALPHGPGRPAAVKRPSLFPSEICFLWRFCMGARGA
jgi:hypothetical protein